MIATHTPLALASAKVISSDGAEWAGAHIRVQDGEARLVHASGADLGSRSGVVAVGNAEAGRGWLVTFENGDTWTVAKDSGCGCGGSV